MGKNKQKSEHFEEYNLDLANIHKDVQDETEIIGRRSRKYGGTHQS